VSSAEPLRMVSVVEPRRGSGVGICTGVRMGSGKDVHPYRYFRAGMTGFNKKNVNNAGEGYKRSRI